jgi:hypothetical protein
MGRGAPASLPVWPHQRRGCASPRAASWRPGLRRSRIAVDWWHFGDPSGAPQPAQSRPLSAAGPLAAAASSAHRLLAAAAAAAPGRHRGRPWPHAARASSVALPAACWAGRHPRLPAAGGAPRSASCPSEGRRAQARAPDKHRPSGAAANPARRPPPLPDHRQSPRLPSGPGIYSPHQPQSCTLPRPAALPAQSLTTASASHAQGPHRPATSPAPWLAAFAALAGVRDRLPGGCSSASEAGARALGRTRPPSTRIEAARRRMVAAASDWAAPGAVAQAAPAGAHARARIALQRQRRWFRRSTRPQPGHPALP